MKSVQRTQRDTIVAVSSSISHERQTGRRDLPRSILRLSGSSAIEFAATVFESATPITEPALNWRRVPGHVRWHNQPLAAAASVMRSPRSYTREDVVELQVPALPWLISELLEALLRVGARLAQPGEFTRRAYENGRISIEQAEAVGALIGSLNAEQARVHAARLGANAHRQRAQLRTDIEDLLSLVELGLDFSQEDVGVLAPDEILRRLNALRVRVAAFQNEVAGAHGGGAGESTLLNARQPRVVLAGPTNAGKSSLFNALLGRDAAIVSPVRHTTRDFVEAEFNVAEKTVSFNAVLVDTAGSADEIDAVAEATRNSPTPLRDAAWQATLQTLRRADVLLVALDRSVALQANAQLDTLRAAAAKVRPASVALIWTKSDLSAALPRPDENTIREALGMTPAAIFDVCAPHGSGLDALRIFLAGELARIGSSGGDASLAAMVAARTAADAAHAALLRAAEGLQAGHGEDIVAVELREAVHAFWQAEGILLRHDAVTESMLDRIFEKFCIGK
jgi:tRNA modification GTPase